MFRMRYLLAAAGVVLGAGAVWIAGNFGDQDVALPDGYTYIELDGQNAAIADRNKHMVVDADVRRYKIVYPFILGERTDAGLDPRLSQKYGYFVFDMKSGQLVEGLDEQAFALALRARGLSASSGDL